MAKSINIMFSILYITLGLLLSLAAAEHPDFHRNISPEFLGLYKEKLSHLRFYLHDILSGPKPSSVKIAQARMTYTSPTLFGLLLIADDALTVGPEPDSKVVGRSQGIQAFADQKEHGLVMVHNLAFTKGIFNGSTLTLLGRNPLRSDVREIPIVGGTGTFRFARGYAKINTHNADPHTGDTVEEFNVYVFHY